MPRNPDDIGLARSDGIGPKSTIPSARPCGRGLEGENLASAGAVELTEDRFVWYHFVLVTSQGHMACQPSIAAPHLPRSPLGVGSIARNRRHRFPGCRWTAAAG